MNDTLGITTTKDLWISWRDVSPRRAPTRIEQVGARARRVDASRAHSCQGNVWRAEATRRVWTLKPKLSVSQCSTIAPGSKNVCAAAVSALPCGRAVDRRAKIINSMMRWVSYHLAFFMNVRKCFVNELGFPPPEHLSFGCCVII